MTDTKQATCSFTNKAVDSDGLYSSQIGSKSISGKAVYICFHRLLIKIMYKTKTKRKIM